MSEEKKTVWIIEVDRASNLKVAFSDAVTKEDAIRLFDEEEFDDIIDEEDVGYDVIGAH